MYKVMFVNNPHDSMSEKIKEEFLNDTLITDEKHVVNFDQLEGIIPLQAVPCIYIIASEELQENFSMSTIISTLEQIKVESDKDLTKQLISENSLLKDAVEISVDLMKENDII